MATLHDFTLKTIDGNDRPLAAYKGKAVLVVNVASRCGYTPQYAGLQKLHEEYGPRGLVVAGVPSNDFGAQEPGSEGEIKSFCENRYRVSFPMFAKLAVKGAGKHPVYGFLTTSAHPEGEVQWNFEKFLVGRDGRVIARFGSGVDPASAELRDAVARALA